MKTNEQTIKEQQEKLDRLGIDPALEDDSQGLVEDNSSPEHSDNLLEEEIGVPAKVKQEKKPEPKSEEETEEEDDGEPEPSFQERMAKARSEKRRNRFNALESKIDKLAESISSLTKGEQKDKLRDFAEKNKLDPEGLKELTAIIAEDVKSKITPTEEADETDESIDEPQAFNPTEEKQYFNAEWDDFSTKVAEEFPNASAAQLLAAKKLMESLAFSSQLLASSTLDEVMHHPRYYKQFKDVLYSVKKKGFEPSGGRSPSGETEIDLDQDITSTEQAMKARQAIYSGVKQSSDQIIHRA